MKNKNAHPEPRETLLSVIGSILVIFGLPGTLLSLVAVILVSQFSYVPYPSPSHYFIFPFVLVLGSALLYISDKYGV
ncbi:MAG: hypothetical protein WC471_03280 [Candidatus Woesearchaeota archaeon]